MPRGSVLSGLEKLLKNIASELKGLKRQVAKLAKKRGKPGRKPGPKPGRKPGRKPGPKPGRKPGRVGRPPGRPKVVVVRGRKRPGRKPRKCSVRGCKNKIYAKGLCANHYQKSRREARKQAGK